MTPYDWTTPGQGQEAMALFVAVIVYLAVFIVEYFRQ